MSDELRKMIAEVVAEELAKGKKKPCGDDAEAMADTEETEKAEKADAAPVEKSDEIKKVEAENEELKKRLAALEEKDALVAYGKRAIEIGLPETEGETLLKAERGDKDAVAKLGAVIKGLTEQVKTGKVFAEFGSANPNPATSYDALMAKADELRKADPKLTKEQAFSKAYEAPENRDIVDAYKRETARAA